jgi:predicted hotdog family 3-hydroxylacyl-ACP dehydratase
MIVKCSEHDKNQYLEYIGDDWGQCPYLYLNFIGLSAVSPNVDVFLCRGNESICAVILRYYNALHIFSRERELDAYELKCFIAELDPMVIWINENAFNVLSNIFDGYSSHILPVMACSNAVPDVDTSDVTIADEADLPEIAELMLEDELYRSGYENAAQIIETFSERMRQGIGISYIVRIDGRLAAHISINAMADGIAVYGALVVGNRFRRQGLAKKVRAKLMEDMASKNIIVMDFAISEATKKIDAAGGGKCIGNVVKLSKTE